MSKQIKDTAENVSKNCCMTKQRDIEDSIIPEWLNENYFIEFLKENMEYFDHLQKFSIQLASKKGENYTSSLYRIKVVVILTNNTSATRSYIMKIPLPPDGSDTIASMPNLFSKEILMYSKIIPRFEQLYADQGIIIKLAPEYYKLPSMTPEDAKDSIILQDLIENNFSLQNRFEGLNMEYTQNALKKLAEFHAASARYTEVYGPYEEIFNEHMFTEESRSLYDNAKMDYFLDYIKEYRGHEEYQDLIPNLLEKFVDQCIHMGNYDPLEFNVLNHGDFWINNILFQYDSKANLLNSRFIDFQLCKYGSPSLDLYMLLLSAAHLSIKLKYFDYFIKFYYNHLTKNLRLLKYEGKIPLLKDFHGIMYKYGFTGFATFFYCLTVCLLDPENGIEPNIDCFISDSKEAEEIRRALFLNDNFKSHAEIIMPWLARRGFLE